MTDATSLFRLMVSQTTQFVAAYENMLLLSDRIQADSNLPSEVAAAASAGGRPDITAAVVENLHLCMVEIEKLLEAVNPNVPTGGELKLALYEIL
jgi:hypothetical protein